MTGYNLPPGVSVNDIPGNRPEDMFADWIAEGNRYHCEVCGSFLRFQSDEEIQWEECINCDGKARKHTHVYGEYEQDEGILAIIGEEFRGQKYDIYYYPCGIEGNGNPHEPHKEILAVGVTEKRKCRNCGYVNERSVM